ncbi:MAG TPA: glycosyltransferase [Aliidongia sp.]|nr:glycosyltransferase [Aliidongia sp.]
MTYVMHDLEVTAPLPTLAIPPTARGYALVLRRRGRVVGFMMEPATGGTVIEPAALAPIITAEVGAKLLQESIAEELDPSSSQPAAMPSLTIAICTKDRPARLQRCLSWLLRQVEPGREQGQTIEVLVVDNAPSDDQTRKLVEGLAGVRYVLERRPGLDFARNRALAEARGEWIAFLDDDVVVDRGWLAGLREAWAENPDAGAFTGLVLPYELATPSQIIFEQRGGFRRGFDKVRYGACFPANSLYPCASGIFGAGCNMAFRRDLMIALGGFDEALDTGAPLPGGGDLDAFFRVVRAGHVLVYEPQLLVYHEHRRELTALRRQYWSWGLGCMAFLAKCYRVDPPVRPIIFRFMAWWIKYQVKEGLRSLRRGGPPLSMVLAEIWGGIAGVAGEYSRSERRIERIRRAFP